MPIQFYIFWGTLLIVALALLRYGVCFILDIRMRIRRLQGKYWY
jgi:hypothetical protein